MNQLILASISILFLVACGVKGDPVPPERAAYIGRGRPTFKGATKGIKVQQQLPPDLDRSEADEKEQEELRKQREAE
jgi:hypothetical protein